MANVNLTALDMFRTAKDWTADSIANLDGRSIKNVGEYGGALSALSRSSIEKAANNEMRTELLKSLANAFDMQVMTDNDGKARFTREFLRNLERKIGTEFKRDDFKLDADGYVCSGRPLTARRIRAIVSKVTLAALDQGSSGSKMSTGRADAMVSGSESDSYGETGGFSARMGKGGKAGKADMSAGAVKSGPVKTDFGLRKEVYNPFFDKLDVIKGKIRKAPEHVQRFYARIEKSLDYLANQLDTDRFDDDAPDHSALRNDQGYEFEVIELGGKYRPGMNKFEYYDQKQGSYVPLKSTHDFNINILSPAIGGGFIHLERATRVNENGDKVTFRPDNAPDIQPLRKYIADTLRLLVSKAIDLYFASEEAGKLDEFFEHLKQPGACIEDQGMHFVQFEEEHLSKAKAVSAEDARVLNLIADGKAPDLPEDSVNQFMDALLDFEGEKRCSKDAGWNKQLADAVKSELRGKKCVMQDFDAPHKLGEHVPELVGENGLPVVKELTDELIDELGPKILKEYFRS